jgi:two-component system, NtrC family, sensor kinase
VDVMADDRDARIAQLEAEVVALREREATADVRAVRAEGALAEALERQTATSDILRVIASSAELSQVFEEVAQQSHRLCDASSARIWLVDGAWLRCVASVAS